MVRFYLYGGEKLGPPLIQQGSITPFLQRRQRCVQEGLFGRSRALRAPKEVSGRKSPTVAHPGKPSASSGKRRSGGDEGSGRRILGAAWSDIASQACWVTPLVRGAIIDDIPRLPQVNG